MSLHTSITTYGYLNSATHILIETIENQKTKYIAKSARLDVYSTTEHIESAYYFKIDNFNETTYEKVRTFINKNQPLILRFCDFNSLEPTSLFKSQLEEHIPDNSDIQTTDLFRLVIDIEQRVAKGRRTLQQITEEQLIKNYDETKTIDYDVKSGRIWTRGVLEMIPFDQLETKIVYSKDIQPGHHKEIPGEVGYFYTSKFPHPYGEGILKEPKSPTIVKSIYEEYRANEKHEIENINYTPDDLKLKPEELQQYEQKPESGIRIKNDPEILNYYPDVPLGEIIKPAEKQTVIKATNHIIVKTIETEILTDLETNISPLTSYTITINDLLTNYLHSKLYNIPIYKENYIARWANGDITPYNPEYKNNYPTPYMYRIDKPKRQYYGITIDISNVISRKDITTNLRNLLIEMAIETGDNELTISVHFDDHILIRLEPFYKKYNRDIIHIHSSNGWSPDKSYFLKEYWEKAYSEWAHAHRDLIRANKLNAQFQIDEFWSADGNQVQTDKRIEPPEEDVFICYINYHPESNDLKIGRSKNWESRYSLYTRANPPLKTIAPNCILRYYLKCPVHEDAIITEYLYSCMEDFFKNFSDNQSYLERHRSPTGHATEYYSIDTKLSMKDQLNEYVANLTEAFLDLTMQDLANIRQPAKNGDGIHGGKRQEFFNKVNRETKEHIYHVEEALQIVANLDNTTKFREYAIDFLPTFKN